MLVELDKKSLISLVKGCYISYEAMDIPLIKQNGTLCGSYGRWDWNYSAVEQPDVTEEILYELYSQLKGE